MRPRPFVREFFEEFERRSNAFDAEALASQFSDPFMVADPDGGIQVVARPDFVAGVSRRRAFFEYVGLKVTKLLSLDEMPMTDRYVMVTADWQMRFEQNPYHPVEAASRSTYLLFVGGSAPQIVFYLTHQNLMTIIKQLGLSAMPS
jgi:uncharacterized protein DUF4440